MNSCFLSLEVIESVLVRLPCLEELHLTANNYSNVSFKENFTSESLKVLYFNNNSLSNWLDVLKFGKCMPNLESLILSENNLSDPDISQVEMIQQSFTKLHTINLNKLKIQKWNTIDMLRQFSALKNVRIQHIPLLSKHKEEEKYILVVSRLNENLIEV